MAREVARIVIQTSSSSRYTINGENIVKLTITQSCDLTGGSAPYSVLNCSAYAANLYQLFSLNTPITVSTYVGSTLRKTIGTFYLSWFDDPKGDFVSFRAVSALGILCSEYYDGKSFYTGMQTSTLVNQIVNGEFSVDTSVFSPTAHLYSFGWIPAGTNKRDALANIAQAHAMWLSPDIEFKTLDTGTAITVPADRVYLAPRITIPEHASSLTINAFDLEPNEQGFNITAAKRDYNIFAYNSETSDFSTSGPKKAIEIFNYAIPNSYRNETMFFNVCDALVAIYRRWRIWSGKILWNTNTDECRLGERVKVPCMDGTTVTGNVIQSNLNFSGASVVADVQVLIEP